MFVELVNKVIAHYGYNADSAILDEAIIKASSLTLSNDLMGIRRQGAEMIILAIRSSLIPHPETNYPAGALVASHLSGAAQDYHGSGDFAKKLKNFVKELSKARNILKSGTNGMGYHGAVARATISAAKLAVEPTKKDKDLKVIQARVMRDIEELLNEATDVRFAHPHDRDNSESRRAANG